MGVSGSMQLLALSGSAYQRWDPSMPVSDSPPYVHFLKLYQ